MSHLSKAKELLVHYLGDEIHDSDEIEQIADHIFSAAVEYADASLRLRDGESASAKPVFEKSYDVMEFRHFESLFRTWHHFNIIGSPMLDQDDGSVYVLVESWREIEGPHGGDNSLTPGGIPF